MKRRSQVSLAKGRANKIWILGIGVHHIWVKFNYNNSTMIYNNSECTVHSALHSELLKLIER